MSVERFDEGDDIGVYTACEVTVIEDRKSVVARLRGANQYNFILLHTFPSLLQTQKIIGHHLFLSKNLKMLIHLFGLNNIGRIIWGDSSRPLLTQN